MQYSCTRHLRIGKRLQFLLGVSNYNVWFIKNDNRVHRACILVINCNVLLISCCYLHLSLYATDYTVLCTIQRVTEGTWRACLNDAIEHGVDMPELAVTQAVCWHSTELYGARDTSLGLHLRATRKLRQAHKLCLSEGFVRHCEELRSHGFSAFSFRAHAVSSWWKITGSSVQVFLRNSLWVFLPVCVCIYQISDFSNQKLNPSLSLLKISLKYPRSTD